VGGASANSLPEEQPIDPPPPPPPRHAQRLVERGEIIAHDFAISPQVFARGLLRIAAL
jgi:hypothetical protein